MQSIHLFENYWVNKIGNIILYSFPFFFIILADSIMAYVFPIIVNDSLGSSSLMGIVMGISSIAGLIGDFTIPQAFKKRSWKFFFLSAILLSFTFPFFTYLGATLTTIVFFIVASIIWGIYFELIVFSEQLFIVNEEKKINYSKDWGIIAFVWHVSAIIGPIIGALLLSISLRGTLFIIFFIQCIALIIYLLFVKPVLKKHATFVEDANFKSKINILNELKYWSVLLRSVWPAMVLGICVSVLQATFWTLGGILGKIVFNDPSLNWLIVSIFFIPTLFGSLILAQFNPRANISKYSRLSLLLGSVVLSLIFFIGENSLLLIIMIFIGSFLLSFAQPLNGSVFSELLKRLGKEKSHLIGISHANASIAYIITPLFAGVMADQIGFLNTFGVISFIVFLVSIFLIIFSPKKILLPQSKIRELSKVPEI